MKRHLFRTLHVGHLGQYGWCEINEAWVLPKLGMSWGGKVFVAEVTYLGNNALSVLSTAEDNWKCILTGKCLFPIPLP